MLVLSDDCLYIIFKNLCLKDQLNCAKAHPRFSFLLVELVWKTKLHPWQAYFDLPIEDYNDLYAINTGQMKALTVGHSRSFDWFHMDIVYSSRFLYPKLNSIFIIEYDLPTFLDSNPSRQYPNMESLHILDDDAEFSFGKPSAPRVFSPKRSRTGYLVHDWSPAIAQTLSIQQKLGLHLKVLQLSYHRCFHFELFKLLKETALTSLELLVIYFDREFAHVIKVDKSLGIDVKELGYHCLSEHYVWDFCSFPKARKLHLSRITSTLWKLLDCCHAVDHIYVDYRPPGVSIETELKYYTDNLCRIFRSRWPFRARTWVKSIDIHFPSSFKTAIEGMVGDIVWARWRADRRGRAYYQFKFYFDVETDELCSHVEPSLHLYF